MINLIKHQPSLSIVLVAFHTIEIQWGRRYAVSQCPLVSNVIYIFYCNINLIFLLLWIAHKLETCLRISLVVFFEEN
jgi:hypothetical protein